MTEDAEAKYRKKQCRAVTVREGKTQPEKKALKYPYIDADEDHVALQYLKEKGDIKKPRINTVMPKLVYVYEGITNEDGRNELINKKHFGGVYEGGSAIGKLWKEVSEYIGESYDTQKPEKVYINGDGAGRVQTRCHV